MVDLLAIFHRLPYPLRALAASGRGYQLRYWRYGPKSRRLVREALDRESWTPAQWIEWQESTLAFILHRAATRVPFYRQMWEARRRTGDRSTWELLENWPVLEKESLRNNPHAFIADDRKKRHLFHYETSGTTGTPIQLWQPRSALIKRYALYEARIRRWNGVSRFDRWAIFGGQLVAPFDRKRPPFWVWNHGLRQLYLSAYHLSPDNVRDYAAALHDHSVVYVLGYASALVAISRIALERGIDLPRMRVVISNAEPLYLEQREIVEEAFRCPVRDTYGMSEFVAEASECSSGNLHIWPEEGVIEVLSDDDFSRVVDGEKGRLICTGLLNPHMPLIRYEVGDRGQIAGSAYQCECGRTLPVLKTIEGRIDDLVVTQDGRRIGRLDPVFKTDLPIRQAQVVQETLNRFRIRIVPSEGYTDEHGVLVANRLRDRVGNVHVEIESVDRIPRSSNGKLRAVISHVSTGSSGAPSTRNGR